MKVFQIVGYKNAGKTTLTCEFVSAFAAAGYRVGTIKHDAHDHDPEPVGKDTRLHRQAGAQVTAFSTPSRTAWVDDQPTPLEQLVDQMERRELDVLFIEGFKSAPYPKVALLRDEEDADLLTLTNLLAIVTRAPLTASEAFAEENELPVFVHPDTRSFAPIVAFLLDTYERLL